MAATAVFSPGAIMAARYLKTPHSRKWPTTGSLHGRRPSLVAPAARLPFSREGRIYYADAWGFRGAVVIRPISLEGRRAARLMGGGGSYRP